MVRVSPGNSVPNSHGNAVLQSPEVDTKFSPGGVGSFTDASRAVEGPAL